MLVAPQEPLLEPHYFIGPDGIVMARYFGPLDRQQMDEYLALVTGPAN